MNHKDGCIHENWQKNILTQLRNRYYYHDRLDARISKSDPKFVNSARRLAQKEKIQITGEDENYLYIQYVP